MNLSLSLRRHRLIALCALATLCLTLDLLTAADCVPAVEGLVGWWPAEGNAADIAGGDNGTLQGGATANGQGMVGSAFTLDGTNGYVQIPDAPALKPANLTVEAWVRFASLDSGGNTANPGQQYIVFKQNTRTANFEGYELGKWRTGGQDLFVFRVCSSSGTSAEVFSTTLVTAGVWYHVAAIRGPGLVQLYVNGQLQGQADVGFPQDYGSSPLYFGSSGVAGWDRKFSGTLDEVSLYNRALSSNEVAAIYAAHADGKCRPPTISSQPQSQSVLVGANVSLSVTASSSYPLLYQWQRDGVNLSDTGKITGATSPVLSLSNVSIPDSANYRVIVTNALGAATSAVAVLEVVTVLVPPSISTQPLSQTVRSGTNATFTVTAAGSMPLGYRWRFNGTNLVDGGQLSGTTTSTLILHDVLQDNSGDYLVVVTNAAGAVTSATATLTVSAAAGCVLPPAGLVGWWPGDGNANDIAGTNPGILEGNATASNLGLNGRCFRFDGTNDFVRIPDSPVFHLANLTVECWVRFAAYDTPGNTPFPHQQYVVFKQNSRSGNFEGFLLTKDEGPGGHKFFWEVTSAAGELVPINSVTSIALGVWYHVAAVRGPDYIQVYQDGLLEAQASVSFPQDYGNNPLYFGTSGQSYYDRKMHGDLDEVSLYNRALSAEEIAALYLAGAAGKCKGPTDIIITRQPQSQAVLPGTTVLFTVSATGIPPLTYQWLFNGAPISGATNTSLSLTNVQTTNSGTYHVVVTSPAGSVPSAVATLAVGTHPLLLNARTVPQGVFAFTLSGTPGAVYLIEGSTNLLNWTPLTRVTNIAGTVDFTDTPASGLFGRFYRARLAY